MEVCGEGGRVLVLFAFPSRDLYAVRKRNSVRRLWTKTHSTAEVCAVVDTTGATMATGGLMLFPRLPDGLWLLAAPPVCRVDDTCLEWLVSLGAEFPCEYPVVVFGSLFSLSHTESETGLPHPPSPPPLSMAEVVAVVTVLAVQSGS